MSFTEDQITRYSRHILLPEVGGKGQKKLSQAKVFVVGAGGLGCPVAYYLGAAGIGTIGLIDSDVVDLSNLQRQVLHHTPDVGRSKTLSAKEKIQALNPDVQVNTYEERLTSQNAREIISQYDIVIDGVDNFPAKFLINDACYMENKPLVHGGILRFEGRVMTIVPNESACYRCIFKKPAATGRRANMSGSRYYRCGRGHYWHHSSHGSGEAYPQDWPALDGPLIRLRCPHHNLSRNTR